MDTSLNRYLSMTSIDISEIDRVAYELGYFVITIGEFLKNFEQYLIFIGLCDSVLTGKIIRWTDRKTYL